MIIRILLAVILGAYSATLYAEVKVDPVSSEILLPSHIDIFDFHSEVVGEKYRIFVAKPTGSKLAGVHLAKSSEETYPVVVMLDASAEGFAGAAASINGLVLGGHIPPVVVVGVGYAVTSFWESQNLRTRDYAPTDWPGFMKMANRLLWPGLVDATTVKAGGADRFLGFIESELKPYIEKHYAGDYQDTTIIGSSFGGMLAAYSLVVRPEIFNRYVIGSPSLYWDDAYILKLEEMLGPKRKDIAARAYFYVGSYEAREHVMQAKGFGKGRPAERIAADRKAMVFMDPYMVRHTQLLEARIALRKYPNLVTKFRNYEGETHYTAGKFGLHDALKFVFSGR